MDKYLILDLNEELGQHWGPNGNIMTGRNFVNSTGENQSTIPVEKGLICGMAILNTKFLLKLHRFL
ncbi:hypothetical protein [Ornithobacterium rhinotracheale]|uniref:hypothetical protein n=1 Tax=Ornithobacterium rhinotracheale TaxID=28251 RepID=UPI003873293A